ncbi:lysozyme inhibitor LprI family protein [Virgibacillus flavescens]|uniref:lysozyme inhibitor LprI family protein n=1 Tax=Virgibacillus flavescens TaxID=1611422 RepID=UPI003D325627
MKLNRIVLIGMVAAVLLVLAACGSSEESNAEVDNSSEKADSTQNKSDDAKENASDTNDTESEQTDTSSDKEESTAANETPSLKEEYLKKLNETKEETEAMRENPIDDTTYAMKKVEGDLYDIWDGLLNEIYGVLQEQLSAEEMDKLRIEQREWIEHRDKTAKEASLKYEGGTMEQLEYVAVQNNLTIERCFELVKNYMK